MNGEKTSTRKAVRHILTFKFSKLQRIYLFKSWLLWKVSVCQTCSSAFNFNNNFDSLGLDLACCQSCSVDMLYHWVQEKPWATWDHSGPCLDPRGNGFSVKVLRNKLEETAQSKAMELVVGKSSEDPLLGVLSLKLMVTGTSSSSTSWNLQLILVMRH